MFRMQRDLFVYVDELQRIGECQYDVIATVNSDWIVVFTELAKNPGPSITNAVEHLVPQFCRANGLNPAEVMFLERYQTHPDYLDVIHYVPGNTAHWSRMSDELAKPILELLR